MSAKKPLVLDFNTGNLQQIQSGDFIDVAQGGTGATTQAGALASLGAYPASNPNNFISASGAPVQSVAGRTGAIVLSQADIGGLTTTSSPTFAAVTAATFTGALAGNATSATNVAGGAANSLVMQTGAGATGFLAAGSNGQVLVISSNTPSWVNFSSLNLTSGQVTSALGYTPADNSKVGAANGIATLGADGKLTTAQIPSSLLGANVYQGVWNANTNTPALNSGVGTKGYYYKVSVAGTTGLDGNSGWQVGDYAIFNGTTWDWIDGGSSEVTTVAGRVGAIVLSQADISGLTTSSSPTFAAVTAATFTGALAGNASSATTATYLSATQQINIITGKNASMAMAQDATANGSFVCRSQGTGDSNLAGIVFWNDSYAIKLGVRADGYFGLGGWSRAAWSWYSDPSGNMVAAGNVTAYSDPRLKDNVKVIENAIDILDQINGVTFTWNNRSKLVSNKAGKRDYGILANEVKSVMPEIISQSIKDEELNEIYDTVSYEKLVPVLIQAIKEINKELKDCKAEIASLKEKM